REGILRLSLAPAPGSAGGLATAASDLAGRGLRALDYVGVLAIELFEHGGGGFPGGAGPPAATLGATDDGRASPGPVSNHPPPRAILGWPLGPTAGLGMSAMINLVGSVPDPRALLAVPGAHVHLYGKAPRPDRKLGHVTVVEPDVRALEASLRRLAAAVPEPA